MTVPVMEVHDVRFRMYNTRRLEGNNTLYHIELLTREEKTPEFRWPTVWVMQRAAEKYLKCAYAEPFRRTRVMLTFSIRTGLPAEDRAAFFGAVMSHVVVPAV